MEWVISILTEIFKHTHSKAQELTLAIHSEGSAIAGIYSYEIAEQKSVEATMLSRNNGFPLAFKLEVE
jgi:ATP-dependent Clp protease adaptor protein ClpS